MTKRCVAIMAEHPQTFGPSELAELVVEGRAPLRIELPAVLISTTFDVVNGQKLRLCFTTAGAIVAVMLQCLSSYSSAAVALAGTISLLAGRTEFASWLSGLLAGGTQPGRSPRIVAGRIFRSTCRAGNAVGHIVRPSTGYASAFSARSFISITKILCSRTFHNNVIVPH